MELNSYKNKNEILSKVINEAILLSHSREYKSKVFAEILSSPLVL